MIEYPPRQPRVRVQTPPGAHAWPLTRVWFDDRELVGILDIGVGIDEKHGQVVTLRLVPEAVEWLPGPTVEMETTTVDGARSFRGYEVKA